MRRVDEIAQERFDGDIRKALQYMMCNPETENDSYSSNSSELTHEEKLIAADILEAEYIKEFGSKKAYRRELALFFFLARLGCDYDQVLNAQRNPFTLPLLKYTGCMIAGAVAAYLAISQMPLSARQAIGGWSAFVVYPTVYFFLVKLIKWISFFIAKRRVMKSDAHNRERKKLQAKTPQDQE